MLTAGLLLLALAETPAPLPLIAVFAIEDAREPKERLPPKKIAELTNAMAVQIAASGKLRVVPGAQLLAALRALKNRVCLEPSCQIEIGRALAAEKSLATKITRVEAECTVVSTVLDLRTAASEHTITWKGACAAAELGKGLEQVPKDLAAAAEGLVPANVSLDAERSHLGDTEDKTFNPQKPVGPAWEKLVPVLPAAPKGCRYDGLLVRVRHVAHSESTAFKAGSFANVVRVGGQDVAMLNAHVAHENAAAHDVRIPIKNIQLNAGQSIEIEAGKAFDGANLDDFELENVRLAPSCALKPEDKPKPVALQAELRHVGDSVVKEWRRPKPDGARWVAAVPVVPELPIQCGWNLRLTLSDVTPATDAEYQKGGSVDTLKVGGLLVGHLNDYVSGTAKEERFIPLRGAKIRAGVQVEIAAGRESGSKNLDDFEVEKAELVATCSE